MSTDSVVVWGPGKVHQYPKRRIDTLALLGTLDGKYIGYGIGSGYFEEAAFTVRRPLTYAAFGGHYN